MARVLFGWFVAVIAVMLLAGCGGDSTAPNGEAGGTAGVHNSGGAGSGAGSGTAGRSGGDGSGGSSITSQGGSGPSLGGTGSANSGAGGMVSGGANGGAGNGGVGTAGAGGTAPVNSHFQLLWRDDFDTFNGSRWTKQTHTFEENLARFSAANVTVESGLLKLQVTKAQNGDRAYSAGEVASTDLFTFGRFVGRIKFCAGSGLVSSLFTYKDDVSQSWQEIDIEYLGHLPKAVQYNLISGNANNRQYQPKVVMLPYSPPEEFHDYGIEWTPEGVSFFVDGVQTHHDVQATLKDATRLHMNAWPTNNAVTNFAGTFDPAALPCEAQYDWVEAYTYVP